MRNIKLGINKRKDGRWEARYITHYDLNGKSHYKSFYGKTKKEALEKLSLFKLDKINNKVETGVTFGDLIHAWLESNKEALGVEKYKNCYYHFNKYILNYIGTVKMNNLDYDKINNYFQDIIVNGEPNAHKQLTNTSLSIISSIILSSIELGNSKKVCDLKVNDQLMVKPNEDTSILSDAEYERLEKYLMRGICDKNIGILLSLYMGYTINEICDIKWKNIDLEKKVIKLNKETKVIPGYFIPYLKEFKLPNHYYLISSQIEYTKPRTYYAFFKKVIFYCNMRDINFKILKNTYLSRKASSKPELEECIEKIYMLQQRIKSLEKELNELKSQYNIK